MDWLIVAPLALLVGLVGAWRRSQTFDASWELFGPTLAGLSCAGLTILIARGVSFIAAGASFSTGIMVLFAFMLLALSALVIVDATQLGIGFGAIMGSALIALIVFTIGGRQVEQLDNERAAFGSQVVERSFSLTCEDSQIDFRFVGEESDSSFRIAGYRYRILTDGSEGVASFGLTAGNGRYNTTYLTGAGDLIANGEWQSRRSAAGSISRNTQASLSFEVGFAGREPAVCSIPASF